MVNREEVSAELLDLVRTAPATDPLSETTRKERRALLSSNLVAIGLTAGDLIPSRISALGIEVDAAGQRGILVVLLLVNVYFLIAFMIYGVPEWSRSQADIEVFKSRLAFLIRPGVEKEGTRAGVADFAHLATILQGARVGSYYMFGRRPRLAFDFGLPIASTAWAISLLVARVLELPILKTPVVWNPLFWSAAGVALLLGVVFRAWSRMSTRFRTPAISAQRMTNAMQPITEALRRAQQLPAGSAEQKLARDHAMELLKKYTESLRAKATEGK